MTTTTDTNTYFMHNPRGFANEYNIYAVAPEDVADFVRILPDAEKIERNEAGRRGWTDVRHQNHDRVFGGFYDVDIRSCDTIEDAIRWCEGSTQRYIEENR